MELIEMPRAMRNRGFKGWPKVYRVGKNDETPPVGIPYIKAERVDFPLIFRLMVPRLMKQHRYFDWEAIYTELTGQVYYPQRVYVEVEADSDEGYEYGESSTSTEEMTLEQLAQDKASYVDLDMLSQLAMIPTFINDIREAIRVNVTNSYQWIDGYNKKTGICTGSLEEQPKPRSLVILDISYSIPDGVSAGMLTLIKTISDVVNADVILTGGESHFFTVDEVKDMDIRYWRRRIDRSNESYMFAQILKTHDMDYDNVITFGDSDRPQIILLGQQLNIKRWYSFFTGERDTYGRCYKQGAGYGQWVRENCPNVQIIHNTTWAKFFHNGGHF